MNIRRRLTTRNKQRGIVAIIMTIAMLAILSVTALAVDVNHMYMNRTKLQNGVDAAALAAAVVLDNSSSQPDAITAVNETLSKLVTTSGNSELDLDSAAINVTFNSTAAFDGGACTAGGDCYVRVVVNNMDLQSFFMQMFTDTKQIAASAVAGPSAGANTICNVTPITVCAADSSDLTNGGYSSGDIYTLKTLSPDEDIAAGNFHLVNLDPPEGTLPNEELHLREQLAGAYEGCTSIGGTIETKPGGTTGPFGQGMNTRFGDSAPQVDGNIYIADDNTDENITYADYIAGEYNNRRMLVVPMIDCANPYPANCDSDCETNGNSTNGGVVTFDVVTLGCFFMTNRAPTNSGNGQEDFKGEYVSDCGINNAFNNGQSTRNGPYRIVLYKDPFNEDS
ncbi:pilus assembly protein TadG-related protein [Vibrio alginolyticus]